MSVCIDGGKNSPLSTDHDGNDEDAGWHMMRGVTLEKSRRHYVDSLPLYLLASFQTPGSDLKAR